MDDLHNNTPADKAAPEASKNPASESSDPAGVTPPGMPEEAKPAGTEAAKPDLPLVESPQLAGGNPISDVPAQPIRMFVANATAEDETDDGGAGDETDPDAFAADRSSAPPRSFRFALLAATIALAAGLGSFVGSMAASSLTRTAAAPVQPAVARSTDTRDVLAALKSELAELTALKASLDGATRNNGAQLAKVAERLDTLERAQADPNAKLGRIADAMDRIEKRTNAAPEVTGSIAAPSPAAAPAAAPPENNSTVLKDWVVADIHNGRALVENRNGAVFVVGAGSVLPGLGHVDAVKRHNGEWVVITSKGIITSAAR